jgi:hypothetical protein
LPRPSGQEPCGRGGCRAPLASTPPRPVPRRRTGGQTCKSRPAVPSRRTSCHRAKITGKGGPTARRLLTQAQTLASDLPRHNLGTYRGDGEHYSVTRTPIVTGEIGCLVEPLHTAHEYARYTRVTSPELDNVAESGRLPLIRAREKGTRPGPSKRRRPRVGSDGRAKAAQGPRIGFRTTNHRISCSLWPKLTSYRH